MLFIQQMGDYYEYLKGKISERGAQTAKFSKDGFDRWAENTYPARAGQVDKMPTEMPSTTEGPSGGRLEKKMSSQHKMERQCCSDEESMSGGVAQNLGVRQARLGFIIYDRDTNKRVKASPNEKIFGYKTEDEAQAAMKMIGGSFFSALKKGAKTVGKFAKKAAKFVIKHKDTIKEGIKTVRKYAPVVRDVYKASKSKEGRKALLDAALGKPKDDDDDDEKDDRKDDDDDEDEDRGGSRGFSVMQMGPRSFAVMTSSGNIYTTLFSKADAERVANELNSSRGGSFFSALKKGAKSVGKLAKKAAKFVIKHKDTIKEGIKTVRKYAPVVRDVYKASKTKEGRKALLDAALGKPKDDDDDDEKDGKDDDEDDVEGGRFGRQMTPLEYQMELEGPRGGRFSTGLSRQQEQAILNQGGSFSTGLTPEQERTILKYGGVRGGSILAALKRGAKTVGKFAKKAAKFVIKNKDKIKKGIELVREYAPVVRDVYKASRSREGRKALLDAALGKPKDDDDDDGKDDKDDDDVEGGIQAQLTFQDREAKEAYMHEQRRLAAMERAKAAKKERRGGRKPSERGAIVSKVMREMGLSLPQASKYVKENGLY